MIKLGGGLLSHPESFDAAVRAIQDAGLRRRLLIVPGGGVFADAVREVDRRLGLPPETAHWMAVLAMDQYAHLVSSRLADSVLVRTPDGIATALAAGRLAVLAPFEWLRQADPLPHTWDVTSDSIAAWVAAAVGAPRLVLIKPPHAQGDDSVDPWFQHALPRSVAAEVVAADQTTALAHALNS